jgi:DNA adenine methylase
MNRSMREKEQNRQIRLERLDLAAPLLFNRAMVTDETFCSATDDRANNELQAQVLLEYVRREQTAIRPGSLRYIYKPAIHSFFAFGAKSHAYRNFINLLGWMKLSIKKLIEAIKVALALIVLALPFMVGPISYIGGKCRLSKQIISLFPEHKVYCEPFFGGGQVFFHKQPSPVEIVNDLDAEVASFFRVCQHHHQELVRYLRFTLASRQMFTWFRMLPPAALTDVQRAARFYFVLKNSFAGLRRNPTYHYHLAKTPGFNPSRIPEIFDAVHKRLEKVQIECLPYQDILDKFDSTETLHYLDPPYWGRSLYAHNFSEADFRDMEQRLRRLKGKFVLSLNDLPEVRELFRNFEQKKIEVAYTAQKTAGKRYSELLITNFKPQGEQS